MQLAYATNTPRTGQAEHGLFFRCQCRIASLGALQMTWSEIVDRSPVEVLLEYSRPYTRAASHRRRISEALDDVNSPRWKSALVARRKIQTSFHLGGIASASTRVSFSSSVMRFPQLSW